MRIIKVKECPDCIHFEEDYSIANNKRTYFCGHYEVNFKIIKDFPLEVTGLDAKRKIKFPDWCPLPNYKVK